ncbi:MAG: 30S ribosomal protein S15 [Myxococcota bacterium]|jgi:small subunit ribosomal protein S15|nr:30S ribosomal protein S15 [Myxococcales bacterium]MBF94727.1 30S ribosomal protein S15 [Myxococcales bacterium]MEC7750023.1 30S ribosomal protein S15 [Myxococcota bacterium]HBU49132.1 30S ribosomal protein S15 [Myxococcales bacterium]|tara:strand:- start:566 stop:835 length:270 start_codon:yes stop_codon:yes gene_type:complete
MAITKIQREAILEKYQRHPGDTGSPEAQIALMTARILDLQPHFQKNHKDHHSRRGLLRIVSKRRRLLDYLKKTNLEGYKTLIADLGIRR